MGIEIQRSRIAVGWFTLFIIGTDLFAISPLLPSISRQFAVTPFEASWMVTAFSIMYAIGAPWFGSIADRLGKRQLILFGLLGFTVGNTLTSFAFSFSVLVVSRALTGLSAAAVTPSVYAIIGDVAPERQSGGWLAIVGSGLLIALFAGAPVGFVIANALGWKFVFVGLAVASLVLAVMNYYVWPKYQPMRSTAFKSINRRSTLAVLSDVSVTMIWGFSVYGLYTFLGTGLRLYDHFSTEFVVIAFIVYGMGATTGSLSGGRLSDRYGASRISALSLTVLGILLVVVGLSFRQGVWLFPLFLLWSFAGYAFFPAFQTRLSMQYTDRRATVMAWNNAALYAGITLGSIVGGWVITKWPFGILPFICGIAALFGGLIVFKRFAHSN